MSKEIVKKLFDTIESSVNDFNKSLPATQKNIFKEVSELTKQLDLRGDSLKLSINNLKLIVKIKNRIDEIILNPKYLDDVKKYLNSFKEITTLQNEYAREIYTDFTPPKIIKEIQGQSIDRAAGALTEDGVSSIISNGIYDILNTNIKSGAPYSQMVDQIREYIVDIPSGQGRLAQYAGTYTTDALNTYAANYVQAITIDLGLEWYRYEGALVAGSRCWCRAMVKKEFIHKSEFQALIDGAFSEYDELDCVDGSNGLPQGMKDDTTADNLIEKRGGWKCNHQFIPTSKILVPAYLRAKFE